ncbi:hypothetical protein [Sciscionella marina]|uniref:hypothetical protein n=1 Tax=Sciscionella marina TaxID=508770 RepID=UPI00035E6CEA|nr:hypothetical protein [Sciscionella marina]
MRIRIVGTPEENNATCVVLGMLLHVREESQFYPNRGNSELGRTYLDAELPSGWTVTEGSAS